MSDFMNDFGSTYGKSIGDFASSSSNASKSWLDSFSFGDTFKGLSDHVSANKDLYNFGANALSGIGGWMTQDAMAKEAKRMNSYGITQNEHQKKRQEEAEKQMQYGYNNSSFGTVGIG